MLQRKPVIALLIIVLATCIGHRCQPPLLLFTDNTAATGPTTAVTAMEEALLNRIDNATISIDAAIYDFDRTSVRDALLVAAARGVTVRAVTDDETYTGDPYYADLEAAGIPVVNDNRGSIMHNKFWVIDGEIVWTGSTNMTNTGFTYNHNNSLVFTSTLLADIYEIEFDEMFVGGKFGTAKTDNVTHTLDYNGLPLEIYFSPSDGAMQEVIDEVNAAEDSIQFSIFFFTDDNLRDALIAKAQQGLTISGIWDLLGASNHYSDNEALCAAGIPVKIEDFGGLLHDKFMIIDAGGGAPRVITGSMNWTGAGGGANDENTVIIHDGAAAQAYLATYQELYNALGPETLCVVEQPGLVAFLPLIFKPLPTPTPTATATATPSPTSTATPTATPTTAPATTGDVNITGIHADGSGRTEPDEYVEFRNDDSAGIQLQGWTLRDEANHTFTFPNFIIAPGQVCRVYTNENHPEWCGFSYGSGSAIWNNSGDCATLRDGNGAEVDRYCYSSG